MSIPKLLAVTAVAVIACGDDGGDTTTNADTEDASSSTTGGTTSSSSASASTTSSSGGSTTTDAATSSESDGTTRADSTSTGETTGSACSFGDPQGGDQICDTLVEQTACEEIPTCLWSPTGYCYVNCTVLRDEDSCCAEFECIWLGDACDYGAI